MNVAIDKEQLKAVVRLAIISALEDDVYGAPDWAPASIAVDAYARQDSLPAACYLGIPSYAKRPGAEPSRS